MRRHQRKAEIRAEGARPSVTNALTNILTSTPHYNLRAYNVMCAMWPDERSPERRAEYDQRHTHMEESWLKCINVHQL